LQVYLLICYAGPVMAKTAERASTPEATIEDFMQATWQLTRRLRAEANTDELTWSQMVVVSQLSRGAKTTADLARAESVKPQSMSGTLWALEEAGIVERRPHPTDGRQVLFALTKKGLAIRENRSRLKRAWIAKALAQLSPAEMRAIAAALEPIRKLANL
jgi:DNA-binding MarR family transcriptional regulator